MRKSSHRVCPRVEAMESRALLSALAPLSTPHPLESRGLSSAPTALSTAHHVDDGVAEIRGLPHQAFPRASVRIKNETDRNLVITVTASLWVGTDRWDRTNPHPIKYTNMELFKFKREPPRGNGWSITIDVKAPGRSPMTDQTLFPPANPNREYGYYGQIYKITLIGTGFMVTRVNSPRS